MRYRYMPTAFALVFVFRCVGLAQGGNWDSLMDAQTGRPRPGFFFDGGLDAINLYNGNVMLDLPVLTQPGRELSTGLHLTYNSQNWETLIENYRLTFPSTVYTGGWRLYDPVGERPLFEVLNTACWEGTPAQEEWWVLAWWIDGFGTKHRYSTIIYTEAEECYVSGGPPIDNLVLLGSDPYSYDGSELWTGASPYETVIRFPDGSVIEFGANPTFRTANGNYLSRGSNGLPLQDTLGRVIGFETNKDDPTLEYYKRYTVSDPNGNPQVYTFNYVDGHSVWRPTDWYRGWTTINDVLTSIELPGGETYTFEYDHPQGFLTKMTLPTGGTITYAYPTSDPYAFRNDYAVTRTLSDGVTSQTWQFSRNSTLPNVARDVTVTYPEGNRVVHRFDANGLEYETRSEESWGAESQRVTTTWLGSAPSSIKTTRDSFERETDYSYVLSPTYAPVLSQVEETDWHVAGSPSNLLSRTNYYWSWPVLEVPSQRLDAVELRGVNPENGQFELQGRTEYFYDQFGLTSTQNVPNKGAPASFRGNITTQRQWSSPSEYVEDRYEYDDLGNTLRHIDPLGHAQVFSYADNFSDRVNRNSYAYLTRVTNAIGQSASSIYHYPTGLLTGTSSVRGLQTSYAYDSKNRPTSVSFPNGRIQSWSYDEASRRITETTGAAGNTIETYLDRFSRPVRTVQIDPAAGNVYVDTEYDGNGRVKRVSEPYRSGQPSWSTTSYDGLDRTSLVIGPDGNPASQYVYRGNTVNDGNQTLAYDALGRLTDVWADTMQTHYDYYPFGALHRVSGQTRTFAYDWLGRRKSETHPESGTTTYQYDSASRLISRTDARGVAATYAYDEINRLRTVNYSGGAATPPVTYSYDQNGYTGLRTAMQDGLGSVSYTYNAAGQISSERRTFYGVTEAFTAGYEYDTEGRITRITYPSGRAVNYTYQTGTTRPDTIRDELTGAVVVSAVSDNPAGQITSRTFGNGVIQNRAFNGLGQPDNVTAAKGGSTLMNLSYGYDEGRIATRADGLQPEHSVQYSYDGLRRLQSVAGTAVPWTVSWQLDPWGNRTAQTPTGLAVSRVGSQSFGYTNNRVVTPAWEYDPAGNVTYDGASHYYYDAESRLIQIDSSAIQYGYDGEGRRSRKTVGGIATYSFYGQFGLMSEFSTSALLSAAGNASSNDRLQYRIGEPTGTTVLVMDAAGNVRENNRVLPYGEPWTDVPQSLSVNDLKFTTYSRDSESGLDYAMARYYASRAGRFLTPDPGFAGVDLADPQSFNAYSYTANDPINRIDQDGANYTVCVWNSDRGCYSLEDSDYELLSQSPGPGITMPGPTSQEGFVGWIFGYEGGTTGQVFYYLSEAQRFGMEMSRRVDASNQMLEVAMAGSVIVGTGAGIGPTAVRATVHVTAKAVGWVAGATGGSGVVLGSYDAFPNYLDAARALRANALSLPIPLWNFFKYFGESWTVNRAFLDASISKGQIFLLNNPPVGATGAFAQELAYLASKGIDAAQWIMVRRPF